MDYKARFRLGPLGAMMQIPSPSAREGLDTEEMLVGAAQQSMYGRTTVDVFNHKGSWQFKWPYATHEQYTKLRMMWLNPPADGLRMWDPFTKNLMGRKQSMGNGLGDSVHPRTGTGSITTAKRAWTADTPLGMIPGEDYWVVSGGGTFGFTSDLLIPIITGNVQQTLSALVRGVGSVSMSYRLQDASGNLGAFQYGAAVTLGANAVPVSLTVPAASTAVAVAPYLSMGGTGEVRVYGQQAELGPTRTAWEPGGGAPAVWIESFSAKRLPLGRYDISFSVREV